MNPEISLIVCTRNRAPQLKAALESFARQDFPGAWELVLVDNGSTDETDRTIAEFVRATSLSVLHLTEPLVGVSRARNRGLAHARAPIVAFTDDDCYPAENYLTAIRHCFSDPNVAFCGGRVLLYDPTDQRVTIQELNEARDIAPLSFVPAVLIHGANMAFRRESLMSIDGFDERLGAGTPFKGGEDNDVLVRCSVAGLFGRYDPGIVVYHHHRRKTAAEKARLLRSYWRALGACACKHCIHPKTGPLYLRHFYWQLRGSKINQAMTEIYFAALFFLFHGPTAKRIWNHPHRSLTRNG